MTKNTEFNESPEMPTAENPMIVPRLQKNTGGGVDVVMSLSQEQTYVLVNFAIMMLVSQGLVVFQDAPPTEDAATPEAGAEIKLGEKIH